MKITINRTDDNYLMEAVNETGNKLLMDGTTDIGGGETAFRPMQLLLAAVGGCSSIDVIMILKKQRQHIESFTVEVVGDKEKIEEYSLFRRIHLKFILKGQIEIEKAEKAIQLSLDKYCSVAKTLEPTATIDYSLEIV